MLPTLYAKTKKGKIQEWKVWTEGDEIHVEYGQAGGQKTKKVTKAKPKNVGRANATTADDQAIKEAQSKWNKQKDKGYFGTPEEALTEVVRLPMLASDYLESSHRISYPCYVSEKLDGVRALAYIEDADGNLQFEPGEGECMRFLSRGGKYYPNHGHIEHQLNLLFNETNFEMFDGELYIHGMLLQHINSLVKKPQDRSQDLLYCIFDVPSDKPFSERMKDLEIVREAVERLGLTHIKVILCRVVNNEAQARMAMDVFLMRGFEGLMLRNFTGKYEWGDRSGDLQKWKDFKDMEVRVIAVTCDRNYEGVLTCAFDGKTFDVKMRGDWSYREYENQKKLIGKWITVKYQALTADGLPQFPVGISERSVDDNGNPLE